MVNLYNRIQGRSLEQLAALSDGIFAFAMTLLVLDLHIPTAAQVHGERELLVALGVVVWALARPYEAPRSNVPPGGSSPAPGAQE